ncbi:hypothetical protein F4780DRAFT_782663 [Xylariomycetidae sp. FL0641]|nr:hypothetical protein F4780DRAFT_782663 [Xylariomycetidae sp. FL0641]
MAAATLINPATAYHPHTHNPPFSPYHQPPPPPPPPPAMPGMISPGESRRASNESEPARQSLPSISEVFSASKPVPYSPSTPTTMAPSQSLPPPFSAAGPARSEPATEPRSMPPHDDKFYRYGPRQEGPPQGPPSAYPFPEPREANKAMEPATPSGHSNHQAPPQMPYPPGQLPLSAAPPVSPRHFGPPHGPYDAHRPPLHADEDYGMHRARYDSTLNRHFEAWGYSESLSRLAYASRTLFNFAEAWGKIASEQHGGHPIPERLPTEREVMNMLSNADWVKSSLENVRDIVQHSMAEKARDHGRSRGPYDGDDEMSMYGDGMKPSYGLGEVKKRRGRAAPPGRCHSCNRIDTPEWRRGPDGARTLCNACGLHYAKLERKRQMEQRSIRPKAVEERV